MAHWARVADSRTLLPVLSLPPDAERPLVRRTPRRHAGTGPGRLGRRKHQPSGRVHPLVAPRRATAGSARTRRRRHDRSDRARERQPVPITLAGRSPARPPEGPAPGDHSLQRRSASSRARQPLPRRRPRSARHGVGDDPRIRGAERPSATGGPTVAGTGQEAARTWLAELTKAAAGRCVVALPFAGVDLDGLQRVGNTSLTRLSLRGSADLVDSILGVRSVRDVAIPTAGVVTNGGADELVKAQISHRSDRRRRVAPPGPQRRGWPVFDSCGPIAHRHLRPPDQRRPGCRRVSPARCGRNPRRPTHGVIQRVAGEPTTGRLGVPGLPSIAVPDVRFPARPGDPCRSAAVARSSRRRRSGRSPRGCSRPGGDRRTAAAVGRSNATPLPTVVAQTTTASRASGAHRRPDPRRGSIAAGRDVDQHPAGLTWQPSRPGQRAGRTRNTGALHGTVALRPHPVNAHA